MNAASVLRIALGDDFSALLVDILKRSEHALGHAILASMRVENVITTNFDELYEAAAMVPFRPQELQVLPWSRVQPGVPWLLKLHGGLGKEVIVSTEDYAKIDSEWRPLASIVQALLMTRHMLFVGYSLTDQDFVQLASGVRNLLGPVVGKTAAVQQIGTVLAVQYEPQLKEDWAGEFEICELGQESTYVPESGRRLEIFLDRVAARAAAEERSWILDPRYEELLKPKDGSVVEKLMELNAVIRGDDPLWDGLRKLLHDYGATTD